jgi:hypothetical protein
MLSCYAMGNPTTPGQVGGALPTPAPESTTSGDLILLYLCGKEPMGGAPYAG